MVIILLNESGHLRLLRHSLTPVCQCVVVVSGANFSIGYLHLRASITHIPNVGGGMLLKLGAKNFLQPTPVVRNVEGTMSVFSTQTVTPSQYFKSGAGIDNAMVFGQRSI